FLIAAYRDRLRQRSNVAIPNCSGRVMFGIIDGTSTLEYGDVFIQYTTRNKSEPQIVLGNVAITKNPCLYPDDIRILKAADVPQLHHLYNCVVFPSKEHRPHTNEISGSDLDGDVYWIN
ncbi:unnamed protein product, partial [Didymodactylos carnosus]